jgi:hypothetical protein
MGRVAYCTNGHFLDFDQSGEMDEDDGDWPVVHAWQVERLERKHERLAFCSECGSQGISACANCHKPIVVKQLFSDRPSYCSVCGTSFPWTVTSLTAARDFADELELSDDDKAKLKATFDDLTVDTPRTELAAHRFKRFIQKIGPSAGDVLTKIVVNIATEAARKGMGL